MAFGSNGAGNNAETRATPSNMEVYVRLAETAGADMDSSNGSLSVSRSGLYENLNPNVQTTHDLLLEEQPQPQQEEQPQQDDKPGRAEMEGSGRSSRGAVPPAAEVWQLREEEEYRRPAPGAGIPLRRREGMSDLWQNQGAFRSNRKSMKNMFEEVRVEAWGSGYCPAFLIQNPAVSC